jgi:hypothetical protein
LRVLAKPDLDTEGFTYLTMPTRLSYQDFMSASTVRTKYFEEIKDAVLRQFPRYNYIVLFDYEVCLMANLSDPHLTFGQDKEAFASLPRCSRYYGCQCPAIRARSR